MISFNFEAQINDMWSLKLFKVSEILCVVTFDTICSSKFAINCVDRSLPTPNVQFGNILTFCKVTFITKKTVIKTRTKPNIMHKNFLKKENKCSTKNQKKKCSTRKPTNKKNKCFTKKINKIYYSTKKPAN